MVFLRPNGAGIIDPMRERVGSVHFIGICGTAMAATAVALQERGVVVTGSDDHVYPPMSTFLAEHRVCIRTGYAEANLEPAPDLVVVGNAISRGNPEAEVVLERRLSYCSLPELLHRQFLPGKHALVIAGTHGKTTTAALLAWVFEQSGLAPSFLIGGLPRNFNRGARFTDGPWFILEGDEYDTAFFDKRSKFVHYQPEVAILNNLEFDHADIFRDLAAVQTSFRHFIRLIPRNGLLLANGDDPNLAQLLDVDFCPITRFGVGPANGIRAEALGLTEQGSEFTVDGFRFRLDLVGEFNVRNALAVVACARRCGLSEDQIQAGFETFRGVQRRMETVGKAGGVTVIDDFGHHPTAIGETLRALRVKYPGQRLWAVFEPRTNTTRRNVFQQELVTALARADAVVVAQVARLDQLAAAERLDPEQLMRDLAAEGVRAHYLPDVEAIVEQVSNDVRSGDVVCVFSNGGFGGIHRKLLERLRATAVAAPVGQTQMG